MEVPDPPRPEWEASSTRWHHGAPPPGWGQLPPPPPQWQPSGPPQNALAIVGLVCSIASVVLLLLLALFTFGFSMLVSVPLAIAGLVCGLVGRQKVDRGEIPTGRGMAQAAFIVGIVSLVLHLLAIVVGVVLIGLLLEAIDDIDIPEPDETVPDKSPPVVR
jgi:Domain of unknown function (DUF4190)